MEKNRANEIIVALLQQSLAGQLDPSSHFNPQFVAEAIASKIVFEKSYNNEKNDNIIGKLIDSIVLNKIEMENELKKIQTEETMLRNFVKGKISAYDEMLHTLDNIK